MKRVVFAFGGALLLGSLASTAEAQLTQVNGVDACFLGASGSSTRHYTSSGNTTSACSSNAASTQWSMPGSPSSGDDYFTFERAPTPGAAGSSGGSTAISFGADNKSNVFNLGWFRFDDQTNTANNMSSVLRFELFLNNMTSTPVIYDGLTVNYINNDTKWSNKKETYSFSGGAWSNWFTVGSDQYRFAVVGYDTPHPGSAANYCKSFDPIDGRVYSESDNGKLCGQFEKMSSVVPEPSTYALMAAGLAGLGFFARRRRNQA